MKLLAAPLFTARPRFPKASAAVWLARILAVVRTRDHFATRQPGGILLTLSAGVEPSIKKPSRKSSSIRSACRKIGLAGFPKAAKLARSRN